ncbi:zinc dependent phospholipase C family protein [Hufsiella arboris]|uniref:zinc dependent phospholipase C family protein n=1 Tax=Hufsiella arboris TaxID=2695275 RepID=UPI001925D282|nr:zinc dependent phospholipase C family protein [Hufsiella arboris]
MFTKVKKNFFTKLILLISLLFITASWGFYAHKKINTLAVFTLPKGMIWFYKNNLSYISEHAVDPDRRRYTDSLEAPRHYLDADHYGIAPFDSIPEKWNDAVKKYSADTLKAYGLAPWQIQQTYYSLVKAFEARNGGRILKLSSDIGHYLADIHVPLHTTENYNGQLTHQTGIHAFWESRLPELFCGDYDFLVGKTDYIENPLKETWNILRHTNSYKDSVLQIEASLNSRFPADRKFSFVERSGKIERQYSEEYSAAYHTALKGMVEKQMRASIHEIGSFWYSAWVDAGQPDISNLTNINEPDTIIVHQQNPGRVREEN